LKIDNFRLVKVVLSKHKLMEAVWANVDVTTGSWFVKKTVTKTVYLGYVHINWVWAETGEFTPLRTVEDLGAAFLASNYQTQYRDCLPKV
jgi:hypothetical protein